MENTLNFMGDNLIWIIIIVVILLLALIGNLTEKKEEKETVKKPVHIKKPSVDVNLLEKETESKIPTNTETLDDEIPKDTETL